MAAVRRHIIIEPKFQIAFTLAFVRGTLLAIAVPALVTIFTVGMLSKSGTLSDSQKLAISAGSQNLALLLIIAAVAIAACAAVVGLLISHRYAGPLKRVESWIARQLLGEPAADLILRPGDELANVASAMARVMRKAEKEQPKEPKP